MNVIYLAAAHTRPYLPELVDELRNIETALAPLGKRGIWDVEPNRAANLNDVFNAFSEKGPQIKVFHYAGHANQTEIGLEGGGHIRGIAGLFGLTEPDQAGANPLSFVFINGCASKGQVDSFHAAGVGAVIATSRPVGDTAARIFAEKFYEFWAIEGKKLLQAFDLAKSYLYSGPKEQHREIEIRGLEIRDSSSSGDAFPWGLYPNPAFDKQKILDLLLNPPVQLPPLVLQHVKPKASESLLDLVFDFKENDPEARKEIQNGQDPLLVLITRLPWTIGTHLRRLFALDDSMTRSGEERLKELVSAYNELTRFISYISLSALWDERQRADIQPKKLKDLPPVVGPAEEKDTDYIWRIRKYFSLQKEIPEDPFGIEPHLEQFLHSVDTSLATAYQYMEELKQALGGSERLDELILARTGKADGLAEICLQTEAIFTQFLKVSLWLTQYRLYTVRSVLVDKIRYLELNEPYIHKTMTLHGAFSDIQLISTSRKIASDNACILLAPAHPGGADPLAGALNLSPFYIDKSAYLEEKIAHYPAVYVLKHKQESDQFIYENIDADVNHNYLFAEDHHFVIKKYGAVFPEALKMGDGSRFEIVHKQLVKLANDFHQA